MYLLKMTENPSFCQSCKTINAIMKNQKICLNCYNKKLKLCNVCNKSYIGIEAHNKMHEAQKKSDGIVIKMLKAFTREGSQYCKQCKQYKDESKYYFSIKKCKDCHTKNKKEPIYCEKCNKTIKRSAFYKHSCSESKQVLKALHSSNAS
jgi:hypothetical protein